MRIGVTYDLRSDYLAMGMSEEDSAEFDREITIASICDALRGLGTSRAHRPYPRSDRAAGCGRALGCCFQHLRRAQGYAREAQVPALLEAYGIPSVFSDPLTLALTLDKAWTKRIVAAAGVPTAEFAVIEKLSDIASVTLPFPLFLKPIAEGSGKGVNERSRVDTPDQLASIASGLLRGSGNPFWSRPTSRGVNSPWASPARERMLPSWA
jgi:D-alanine-D-alanine ligase